jgi:hypothetical protein
MQPEGILNIIGITDGDPMVLGLGTLPSGPVPALSYLSVQDDGNLVIYDGTTGQALWQSGTYGK